MRLMLVRSLSVGGWRVTNLRRRLVRGGTISVAPELWMGRWNGLLLLLGITGLVRVGVSRARASMLGSVDIAGRGLLWPSSRGVLSQSLVAVRRLGLGELGGKRGSVTISPILLTRSSLRLDVVLGRRQVLLGRAGHRVRSRRMARDRPVILRMGDGRARLGRWNKVGAVRVMIGIAGRV